MINPKITQFLHKFPKSNMNLHLLATVISILFITTQSSSIYDALSSNGLPIGLLPKGITNYTIDPSTNRFEVHLNSSCNTKFETSVRFDWNFAGVLSYGKISNLSGIAAQDLFLWFPVKGIHVDVPTSGLIYFDVGVVFKQFALSSFEIPKDCTAFDVDGLDTELIVLKDPSRTIQQPTEGDDQRAVA
ncbi:hypothetical protein HanRHA438_Chr15g0727851 [Helianthus annuus]|uniref:Uncharacterized protein n=1 Tax=Helianthus annuus TaxID=4232 RepID=A0A251SC96_HELAN|nr:hypothetical protein HanXRQr2_Chr15g0715581 [Helianthus annuus]KAJ0452834.1 hypothetical protein HanHA300_Chr15g0583521 [Helianthus annuus]KAJ0457858.1 hypothetical protein HanIR_Chr15g0778591 [Helianthus annuus]KAJ0474749.1 hypothetical protein HanHA89_Chr15g0633311 [Helianthus annuus]KAJ0650303.1 hypothetical protein HanLR1_Chr15g0594221 [Helianthus annuus]